MQVTCENCGIEYPVDEARIKPEGSRVRCSICKHIFKIHKPSKDTGGLDDFYLDLDTDWNDEGFNHEVSDELPSGTDFPEDDDFFKRIENMFGGPDTETENGKARAEQTLVLSDESVVETEFEVPEPDVRQFDEPLDDYPMETVTEKSLEAVAFVLNPHTEDDTQDMVSTVNRVDKCKRRLGVKTLVRIVFIAMLALTVVCGGYLGLKWFNADAVNTAAKSLSRETGELKIAELSERFFDNPKSGKLLVVTGWLYNSSKVARQNVKVTGRLYEPGKKLNRTVSVRAGNWLDDSRLSTLGVHELLSEMRAGSVGGATVPPSGKQRFMIIFSELPEFLEEYDVTVDDANAS